MDNKIIKAAALVIIGSVTVRTIKIFKERNNEVEVIEPECTERN